jgi:hypothetical protein
MSIAFGGGEGETDSFQRSKLTLPPLPPLLAICTGYGLPRVATYSVPPFDWSVMPTTGTPLTVVVPVLESVPWPESVASTRRCRLVSEAIDANSGRRAADAAVEGRAALDVHGAAGLDQFEAEPA